MNAYEDHFSELARQYASYRPQYPEALFAYLASISPGHQLAWDCGTGSGQAACGLASYFDHVIATDASAEQIAQAMVHERVEYRVERAEEVSLETGSVDLVTVAIAVHWFDLDLFYEVVRRVGRPDGILAVWTYHLPVIESSINAILNHYYADVLAGYWPERFHYQADRYQTLPFPFDKITPPEFEMQANWELDQLVGFLNSWSATRRYQKEHGQNPIELVWESLSGAWGDPTRQRSIRWPIYLLVGRIQ
jgi:SAM-dependent methyltransferase